MDGAPIQLWNEDTILEMPNPVDSTQPPISCEGEGEVDEDAMEVDAMADTLVSENKELMEDDLREYHKVDSVNTIASLRMQTTNLFRLHIPLCRMVPMPMVRPTLSCDLDFLEHEFSKGYRDGVAIFYVTTTDEARESSRFIEEEMEKWDPFWKEQNEIFNANVEMQPELRFLKNLKFFVCDGNHRVIAWMRHIARKHLNDKDWHYAVDSIVLDTKGRIELVMHVMHDINK